LEKTLILGGIGGRRRRGQQRMKRLSQSENNTQLQMWLVVEAESDTIKNNIA